MPTRHAKAIWEGTIKGGKGSFETQGKGIQGAYSFASRFEDGQGSNPEELLAAAEAACFSMALSLELEKAGKPPKRIETQASCTIEKDGAGFSVKAMKLVTQADVPGMDRDTFVKTAEAAKKGCPVSKALQGVPIELSATLLGASS